MAWRLGIDTGGTFTDVIAFESATRDWRAAKIWSNAENVAESINAAMRSLRVPPDDVSAIVYGTTKITNAVVEDKLAPVALVSTAGFKDVLLIARQKRDLLYDLKAPHRPAPPVPSRYCFEIEERCTHTGSITKPVNYDSVVSLMESIPIECEALAISLLHSYANGANENEVAAISSRRFSHISLSHEISPEAREYERTITTVLNAALLPIIRQLVASLRKLPVEQGKLSFFHSAGGLISPQIATKYPLTLAMSGPAAGVLAASAVAAEFRESEAISFDMGGTTTDCSLIIGGRPSFVPEIHLGPRQIRQPAISVESIGAGGGSLVRYSKGHLTVGPQSAGADPGPACYLRGGTIPTLTDAAAVLGLFGEAKDLHRPVTIDVAAAKASFNELAGRLNFSVEDLALGTVRVAGALAARAMKAVTMNKGVDARACALVAFGGAGPMFAPFVAQEIGLRSIIIPDNSSALSAIGCLVADPLMTRQWTVRLRMAEATPDAVGKIVTEHLQSLRAEFRLIAGHGNDADESFVALLRYPGQSYEIEVPIEMPFDPSQVTAAFQALHKRAYGFTNSDPWEMVALRATIAARTNCSTVRSKRVRQEEVLLPHVRCYFDENGWIETRQYERSAVHGDRFVVGPSLILDETSTIVVPPGFFARPKGLHIEVRRTRTPTRKR
jgi:N-methylhydantoinase A